MRRIAPLGSWYLAVMMTACTTVGCVEEPAQMETEVSQQSLRRNDGDSVFFVQPRVLRELTDGDIVGATASG